MNIDEEELEKILEDVIKEKEDSGSTCSVFSSDEVSAEDVFQDVIDTLDNPIQKKHENIIHLMHIFLVVFCILFGCYTFYKFLDVKFDRVSFYKNKCCVDFYNETRCMLDYYWKEFLDYWLENKNYLEECCYWLSPYSKKFTKLYCNPTCLESL